MNIGTLYHYIGSKDSILSLFQEYTSSLLEGLIEEISSTLCQKPPTEALRYSIEKYLLFVDDIQDVTLFWYQETKSLQRDQREALFRHEERTANFFQKILAAGCESGEFEMEEPRLLAHSIIVLCDMWAFRRWFLRKHYTLEQYTRKQIEFILNGISCEGRAERILTQGRQGARRE
jgi:AcrR family transcriptional regulator